METNLPWRYKGVSAFKLCRLFTDGADIDPFLSDYAGFNVLRVWDYTEWAANGWDSCSPDQWIAFLQYVGANGWYVELTLLTDDAAKRIDPAKRLVGAIVQAGVHNVLIEIGNEPTTNKSINTKALETTLGASGLLYSSGNYEDSNLWFGRYYTCHTARTRDWTRRAHDLYEFYTGDGPDKKTVPHHVPCIGDEPGKVQDVGAVLSEWRAYFGACALMGGGALVHLETGKYGQRPTNQERPCIAAALEGLDAFPADAPKGSYRRIVESGQPPDGRTYVVGERYMVRCQQTGGTPEAGWTPIDSDGVLWTR